MSNIRYIICFEFLGENFFGSQKQPNKRTVQGEIEKALCTLIKDEIVKITPSGRTDAKVNAEFQIAHFDVKKEITNPDNFLYKLNCILPDDLKVFELKRVPAHFHAQKDAKYKHYRYTIVNNRVASVFSSRYLFYPYKKLNIERLNQALSHLIGHHDFTSFKSNSDNPYNDCIIYYAKASQRMIKRQNFIFIDIIGNRFLYNMIRTIVGQLLLIERQELNPNIMAEILASKNRTLAANVVDAKGLTLIYVGYDNVDDYINNLQKEGK